MRNVTLYKNKYSPYGGIQPYFTSERARDYYLETLQYYNLDLVNVNINLNENLAFELKINVDINTASDFNFVVVDYLGTKYYADIYDYSQISIGRTKIYCMRNPLFEVVDYLRFFENFYIDKATFNTYSKYTGNHAAINLGNNVTKNVCKEVDFSINGNNVRYFLTYIIYIDEDKTPGAYIRNLYGEVSNYGVIILPIAKNGETFIVESYKGNEEKKEFHYNTQSYIHSFIDAMSPYIFRIELLYLPYQIVDDGYKFMFYNIFGNYDNGVLYGMLIETGEYGDDYLNRLSAVLHFSEYSTSAELRLFQRENTININLDRFKSFNNFSLNLECTFIPNIQGSSFLIKLYGGDTTIENNSNNSVIVVTSINSTFIVDSDANFKAQNLYYDAMTENARNQKIVHGALNAGENLTVGIFQTALGMSNPINIFDPISVNNQGSFGSGIANLIRGGFEIGHAINDTVAFENERALFAKNEMAKPDELSVGNNAPVKFLEQGGKILYIEKVLTDTSFNIVDSKIKKTGIECKLYTEQIYNVFYDLLVGNYFFIKAPNFTVSDKNNLPSNSILVELIKLLKNGMRYRLYV